MSRTYSRFVERLGGRGADAWEIHGRALAARARGEDVVIMSVGDPEFDTPGVVGDAAARAIAAGDTHYTDMRGREALRALIAARHQERTGQPVSADNVVVVPGAQAGLFCASMCLGNPGDELVTTDPVYTTYEATLRASGAQVVPVPLDASRRFRIDVDRLAAVVGDDTRAIFLANPNNPTGTVLDEGEMRAIVDLACRHDAWIVADEVYAEQVFDAPFRHFAAMEAARERLVTVSSLSKSHAMTGWRLGWMVVPTDMADHLENLMLAMLYGMPGFIQAAAIAALRDCDDDVARMREAYRRRRDLVMARLAGCDVIECVRPDAGMFMLLDVARTGLASGEFAARLFDEQSVSVLDAAAFGAGGGGYVRISFAGADERLEVGCRRILAFVDSLGGAASRAASR